MSPTEIAAMVEAAHARPYWQKRYTREQTEASIREYPEAWRLGFQMRKL